jgi:hypothetical protein
MEITKNDAVEQNQIAMEIRFVIQMNKAGRRTKL